MGNYPHVFDNELKFEAAFVELLKECGWEKEVIKNPTEDDLIDNWAKILFDNNREIDRLGNYPLTREEMDDIISEIASKRTPFALNSFINGKEIGLVRKNPNDKLHFGKEINLKIYDRNDIAGGKSHYQIVEQPRFKARNDIFPDRRGDVMLLINGMPLFHIELKKSGKPLSQAENQIEKYSTEGIFRGIFSLIQIFIAMTPEDAVYFTNPGPDVSHFNRNFFFHWANFDNEPIHDWIDFTKSILFIPMAHQLIGFFTVPDKKDGVLKVLRSYQYYAVSAITTVVAKHDWESRDQRGGFIWHTTGSGKTLTSFKTADLISKSGDADKVVFLVDRKELDTQSYDNYKNFADTDVKVSQVDSTDELISTMKSSSSDDALIVASIQKMYRIFDDGSRKRDKDIQIINSKRVVFIVDECHRDTFGDMMNKIKTTFKNALFFGFTGTPIVEENMKKGNTSSDVFGNELHRYTIGDGIRDGNVLGFDPYKISTYKDSDLKDIVALKEAKANDLVDAFSDPVKEAKYYEVQNWPMAGYINLDGKYVKGIEDEIPMSQYRTDEHRNAVVDDILSRYEKVSHGRKFHSMFATSSIPEAIKYYKLLKSKKPDLKISVLVDPNDDNSGTNAWKITEIAGVIDDYNKMYKSHYIVATYGDMKKDISLRLSHERPYIGISKEPEKQLDMLIVVNQMLTGFDFKWINVLYLDKLMEKENIIQAFSRTNRIFGQDKPFGLIYYYRKPNTMEKNIDEAIGIYSGDKASMVYVTKLEPNLVKFNAIYEVIKSIFDSDGITGFSQLPSSIAAQAKFAKEFNSLNKILQMIKVQDFIWDKSEYVFDKSKIKVEITEVIYLTLVQRYKELMTGGGSGEGRDVPYDIDTYITEIGTGKIDANYINSKYVKFLKLRLSSFDKDACDKALKDLFSSFASLSQEDQKYANLFISDVQNGNLVPNKSKQFMDYITEYKQKAKDNVISRYASTFGIDEKMLSDLVSLHSNEATINEFGRYDNLKATLDIDKAKAYFSKIEGKPISTFSARTKFDTLTHKFIIEGCFELK